MYNDFVQDLGILLSDLFKIWNYKTFGVLLAICGCYMVVKLVRSMFNLL